MTMAETKLPSLLPGVTEDDLKSDTGAPVIDINPVTNPKATQARTFTIKQLTELFNVLLGRSAVQLRLTAEEEATKGLQAKLDRLL